LGSTPDDEFWTVYARANESSKLAMLFAYQTDMRLGDIPALRRHQLTDAGIEVQDSKTRKRMPYG
jgi:hypothetical protein